MLKRSDVFIGRPASINITNTGLSYLCIQSDRAIIQEEVNVVRTALGGGIELPVIQSKKVTCEVVLEILDQADLNAINDSGTGITVVTASGGDNETGQTFTISTADLVLGRVDGGKTNIMIEKALCAADGSPYTVAHNAAPPP